MLTGSRLGDNCNIGQNVVIGPQAVMGNGCKIQNNVSVYKGVILKDNVFCGPSMVFTNVINPRAHINRKNEYRNTIVEEGATLGANCTIVCGGDHRPLRLCGGRRRGDPRRAGSRPGGGQPGRAKGLDVRLRPAA